jgi:hypothetical protein
MFKKMGNAIFLRDFIARANPYPDTDADGMDFTSLFYKDRDVVVEIYLFMHCINTCSRQSYP